MSQNQEIIESKLCAYIDGELDPEGKAEIEKHLEANPQHRRLLESLRATRDLLRWLPREPAPPELSETLNGQLERSVLLNYEGDSLKLRSWPRVFAAAAIIVLTAGLGAAVFYALPRAQKPSLAIHSSPSTNSEFGKQLGSELPSGIEAPAAPPATSEPAVTGVATAGSDPRKEGAGGREIALAKGGGDDLKKESKESVALAGEEKQPAAMPVQGAFAGGNKGSDELDQLANQVAQNPGVFTASNPDSPAPTPRLAPATAGNAMVMLVRSDAPERTEKQLTTYLDSQQLSWRQTQLPQQSASNFQNQSSSQNQLSSQNQSSQLALNSQAAAGNKASQDDSPARNDVASKMKGDGGYFYEKAGKTALKDNVVGKPDQSRSVLARDAQTQPSQSQAFTSAPASQVAQPMPGNAVVNAGPEQRLALDNAANNSYRSNGVYVVQMSRRQAAQLSSTISRDGAQAAEVKDVSGLAYTPPSEAAAGNTVLGENQSATRWAGGGGVAGQLGMPATNPAPNEREASKVASVAGNAARSWNQLGDLKGDRDKALTTQPIDLATTEHFLTSAKPQGAASIAAATAPIPQTQPANVVTIAPSTQPALAQAAPTTAPADEPVNLVIMIEGNNLASVAPATQPSSPSQQLELPAAVQKARNAK